MLWTVNCLPSTSDLSPAPGQPHPGWWAELSGFLLKQPDRVMCRRPVLDSGLNVWAAVEKPLAVVDFETMLGFAIAPEDSLILPLKHPYWSGSRPLPLHTSLLHVVKRDYKVCNLGNEIVVPAC